MPSVLDDSERQSKKYYLAVRIQKRKSAGTCMKHRGTNSHKHNSYKKQRHLAQSFTFQWAFNDRVRKEVVSISSQAEIMRHIQVSLLPGEPLCYIPDPNMDGMVLLSPVSVSFWENALPPVPNLVKK